MKLSDKGRAMIEAFEGRRDRVYRDVAGKLTGGVGHLLSNQSGTNEGAAVIPDSLIEDWFNADLEAAENIAADAFHLPVSQFPQHQFDALVSLAFNLGNAPFRGNTGLGDALRYGRIEKVPAEIRRWNKAAGKVVPGLVARREAEARLFETGQYPQDAAPKPVLKRGATGPEVRRLQELLNKALALEVDGVFGKATEWALLRFERRHNELAQTIVVSPPLETTPEVWAALEKAAGEAP